MSDNTPGASSNLHLGLRIAVGLVGLVFIALFVMLWQVSAKQSATTQALEKRGSVQEAPATEPVTPPIQREASP